MGVDREVDEEKGRTGINVRKQKEKGKKHEKKMDDGDGGLFQVFSFDSDMAQVSQNNLSYCAIMKWHVSSEVLVSLLWHLTTSL